MENKDTVASVESLEEVRKIQDAAEVFHLYLKYHRTGGDLQNLACKIKARADRRMGNLLSTLERKPGARTDKTSSQNDMRSPARSIPGNGEDDDRDFDEVPESPACAADGTAGRPEIARTPLAQILADLAIGSMEAWRWQQLARIPEDLFEGKIMRLKREQSERPIAICETFAMIIS